MKRSTNSPILDRFEIQNFIKLFNGTDSSEKFRFEFIRYCWSLTVTTDKKSALRFTLNCKKNARLSLLCKVYTEFHYIRQNATNLIDANSTRIVASISANSLFDHKSRAKCYYYSRNQLQGANRSSSNQEQHT